MGLKKFWDELTTDERTAFAERCGTTFGHLRNVAYGYKHCAESLAIAIERESNRTVRCEQLRPDVDWAYIRGSSAA